MWDCDVTKCHGQFKIDININDVALGDHLLQWSLIINNLSSNSHQINFIRITKLFVHPIVPKFLKYFL